MTEFLFVCSASESAGSLANAEQHQTSRPSRIEPAATWALSGPSEPTNQNLVGFKSNTSDESVLFKAHLVGQQEKLLGSFHSEIENKPYVSLSQRRNGVHDFRRENSDVEKDGLNLKVDATSSGKTKPENSNADCELTKGRGYAGSLGIDKNGKCKPAANQDNNLDKELDSTQQDLAGGLKDMFSSSSTPEKMSPQSAPSTDLIQESKYAATGRTATAMGTLNSRPVLSEPEKISNRQVWHRLPPSAITPPSRFQSNMELLQGTPEPGSESDGEGDHLAWT